MKQANTLTKGLSRLLYGELAPEAVLERYAYAGDAPFDPLWEVPDRPATYLAALQAISRHWPADDEKEPWPEEWMSPFYRLPQDHSDSFHSLCRFYRTLVHCEARMIMHCTRTWTEDMALTLLGYELMNLQQELIGLVKECDSRFTEAPPETADLPEKLEQFMLGLLFSQLLMLLREIRDRYHRLLEDCMVTTEELYLKALQKPVPEQETWYRTEAYIAFHLERRLRPPVTPDDITGLLSDAYTDCEKLDGQPDQQTIKAAIHRLENVLLCYIAEVETDQRAPHDLLDAGKNSRHIQNRIRALSEEEPGDPAHQLHHLLRRLDYCRQHIRVDESSSEAAQLLWQLEHIFDPSAGSEGSGPPSRNSAAEEEPVPMESGHWALNEYISIEAIREKLGVHMNTLNRYFRESNAPVVKVTQKIKWMHVDDFHAFMQSHKNNQGEKE